MGDSLRNWVLPAVLTEVRAAITCQTQTLQGARQTPRYAFEWKSDGSLDIHSEKHQLVQLVEFISVRKPLCTAWLSDSHTQIRAVFTVEATEAYKRATGRSFMSGTIGSVLGISAYCLKINPTAAKSKKLTIVIQKFKLVGSEGSPTFGKPRGLEDYDEAEMLFSSVKEVLCTLHKHDDEGLESPLSVKSQAGSNSTDAPSPGTPFTTQAPFSTQSAHVLSTQLNLGHESQPQARSLFHQPLKPNIVERKDQLISLLAARGRKDSSTTESETRVSIFGNMVIAPAHESRNMKTPSMVQSKANVQASAGATIPSVPKNVEPGSDPQEPATRFDQEQGRLSGFSNDCEKENSQEKVKDIDILIEPMPVDSLPQQTIEQAFFQRDELELTEWEGYVRLPRKYVQIPKEQYALLESSDSWYSPGSSDGATHLNLPPNVLLDVLNFHERFAAKSYGTKEKEAVVIGKTMLSTNVVSRQYAGRPSQASVEDLSKSSKHQTRILSESIVDIARSSPESDVGQDDHSDEDLQSWSASPQEHCFAPLINFKRTSSQVSHGSPGTSIDRSHSGRHREGSLRSDSPSSSHAVDLELPSFQGDNHGVRRSAVLDPVSVERYTKTSSQLLSSSSPEMESAVPYGIDEDFPSSNDIRMTHVEHSVRTIPSTDRRQPSNLQVIRTPYMHSHLPQSRVSRDGFGYGRGIDEHTRIDHQSSDLVIPSTIDAEGVEYHGHFDHKLSQVPRHYPGVNQASVQCDSSSAFSSASARSSDRPLSSLKYGHCESADDQLYAEFMSYSQTGHINPNSIRPPRRHLQLSREINSRTLRTSSVFPNVQVKDTSSISASQESVSGPSHTVVPATQLLFTTDPTFSVLAGNKSHIKPHSEKLDPSAMKPDSSARNHRRQISLDGFDFGSSQNESQVVDISAMVKANRREFVRRLSPSSQDSVNDNNECKQTLVSPSSRLAGGKSRATYQPHHESLQSLTSSRVLGKHTFVSRTISEPLNSSKDFDTSVKEPSPPRTAAKGDVFSNQKLDPAVCLSLVTTNSSPAAHKDRSFQLNSDQQDDVSLPNEVGSTEDISDEIDTASEKISPTLLDKFRTSYPTYNASERRFIKACVYLEWLRRQWNAAPHPSLWDDFIRAWCFDYLEYISHCKPGNKKMSGIEFYNENVSEPKFMNRIVTPANLHEALLLDPVETERVRKPFNRDSNLEPGHGLFSDISARSSFGSHGSAILSCENAQPVPRQTELHDDKIQLQKSGFSTPFHNSAVSRKPFFETFSQLHDLPPSNLVGSPQSPIRQSAQSNQLIVPNRRVPTESPTLTPLQSPTLPPIQNQVSSPPIALSQMRTNQPDVDIVHGTPSKRRNLPWVSLPTVAVRSNLLSAKEQTGRFLSEQARAFVAHTSASNHSRQSGDLPTVRQRPINRRPGSPVLAVDIVEEPFAPSSSLSASERSPILGTRLFPTAKSHKEDLITPPPQFQSRRATSISEIGLDPSERAVYKLKDPPFEGSIPVKRKGSPTSSMPAKRPAIEECVKKWAPRRKRPSAISRSRSTLSVAANTPRVEPQMTKGRLGPPIEPETQDWSGGYEL